MGKYIAIEGIDGAGKTTLCKLLVGELKNSILIEEPSENEIGKFIKNSLQNKKNYMLNPFVSTLLFFADRIFLTEKIRELKRKYEYIISDRSFLSTYTYQSALLRSEKQKKIFKKIFLQLLGLIEVPDIIIILDVGVETALERIRKDGKKYSLYENKKFLERVLENYRNFDLVMKNTYLVDANRSIEDVKKDVLMLIQQL